MQSPGCAGAEVRALADALAARCRLHRARLYADAPTAPVGPSAVVDSAPVAAGDRVLRADATLHAVGADGAAAVEVLTPGDAVLVADGHRYAHCLFVCVPPGGRMLCVAPAPPPAVGFPTDPSAALWWTASNPARLRDPAGAVCGGVGAVVANWYDARRLAAAAAAASAASKPTLNAVGAGGHPLVQFRGDAYVDAAAAGGLALRCGTNGGYTMVALARLAPPASTFSNTALLSLLATTGTRFQFTVGVYATPTFYVKVQDAGGSVTSATNLLPNRWYFFAARSTAAALTVVTDDVAKSAARYAAPLDAPGLAACRVGESMGGSYFGMDVLDVAFWDRPLADAELTALQQRMRAHYGM